MPLHSVNTLATDYSEYRCYAMIALLRVTVDNKHLT